MRASVFEKNQRLRLSRDGLAAWTRVPWVPWVRGIGIGAAVGVAYFVAAWLSFGLRIPPENVVYWPAAGISAAVLISLWSVARWSVLAGMVVATIAVNLLQHFSVAATAAWVVGNTAEPLIIAGLIHHYFDAHFKIDRLYCVLGLFAAAIAGTAVAATWWTVAYYYLFASLKEPTAAWLHWIISDLAGIVSVAPLVIGLAAALRQRPPRREAIEGLAALTALAVMTAVIVSLPREPWATVMPVALIFPILLWLAARCQPVFAAAGTFMVSMAVALSAIHGLGHFGSLSIGARVLQTQAVILVVAFGTAVLAALFAERRESEAHLARSNAMLQRERDNKLMNLQAAVASISHEIKQPVSAIALNSAAARTLLQSAPPDLEEVQSALDDVISDSHRTSEILDNVRQLFGKGAQAKQPTDVNELVVSAFRLLNGELTSHGVAVAVELASKLPLVMGSRVQLQEVVINLADNAVDAMASLKEARRAIKVKTKRDGSTAILIEIEDTGPGIDPQRLDSIFDAFVTTKVNGMGLGLAICRTIIERHGGKISVASDGRSGALFQISLPIGGTEDHH